MKLKPEECRFAVTENDEDDFIEEGVTVFILPFDKYHEAFDQLCDDDLVDPPEYLVNGDWIMENTCVVENMTLEEVKTDMIKLGFVYDEELE